jgi:hypothetical protein
MLGLIHATRGLPASYCKIIISFSRQAGSSGQKKKTEECLFLGTKLIFQTDQKKESLTQALAEATAAKEKKDKCFLSCNLKLSKKPH